MRFLLWYSIVVMASQIILVMYSKEYRLGAKILSLVFGLPILVYLIMSL